MRFTLFFVFMHISFCVWAAYDSNQSLLNDARSNALGDISVYSVHVENPSLSALPVSPELSISYKNHYLTSELNNFKGSFSAQLPWFAMTFSLAGYGYEHYNQMSGGVQLAKKLFPSFSLGVGLDFYRFYYTGIEESRKNLTTRIGAVWNKESAFLLALWIDNPFQTQMNLSFQDEKEKLPTNIFGGFRMFLADEAQWSVEIENSRFSDWRFKTGFEYGIRSFFLRCGVFAKPVVPTAGVGFVFSGFRLDVSVQYHYRLGVSPGCGLTWQFGNQLTEDEK